MYISRWVYFVTALSLVLQQGLIAVLAKTKADIAKKSSYCYSSCWFEVFGVIHQLLGNATFRSGKKLC